MGSHSYYNPASEWRIYAEWLIGHTPFEGRGILQWTTGFLVLHHWRNGLIQAGHKTYEAGLQTGFGQSFTPVSLLVGRHRHEIAVPVMQPPLPGVAVHTQHPDDLTIAQNV